MFLAQHVAQWFQLLHKRECLRRLQLTWRETQTVAPESLRVTAIAADALTLTWQPIAYRSDGGYYEISYATTVTTGAVSTHTVHGITADKHASS